MSLLGQIINRSPVAYVSRGTRLSWPFAARNSPEEQMRAMGSVGTLFAVVNRLSNAVSQVEWGLYRKARSGKPEDRTEVTAHAAIDLLNHPNPFFTRQELIESVQQHVDLVGEGWLILARDQRASTIPLELWFARPDRMAPIPDPDEYITGYAYTSPNGERVPLDRQDVAMLRMPNPLDPYRGMGPVQSILSELDSIKYSAEWNRNFFLNSAEPGGIVQVDRRLSDTEFREMTNRWREQHQGVSQAHRVAVLEQGAQWVERKFTQRDMQFAQLKQLSREDVRGAFGMPKFAVGDIDDVNRATADAVDTWFARYLMVPRLERWKQCLNNDILPRFGSTSGGLEFDYKNPVPEDEAAENAELTARSTATKTYIDAGFEPADGTTVTIDGVDLVWKTPPPPPTPIAPAPPVPGQPVPPPDTADSLAKLGDALNALGAWRLDAGGHAHDERFHPGVWQ